MKLSLLASTSTVVSLLVAVSAPAGAGAKCSSKIGENVSGLMSAVKSNDVTTFRQLKSCKGIDLNGMYAKLDLSALPLIVGAIHDHALDVVTDIINDKQFDVNRTYEQLPFVDGHKQIGSRYPLIMNVISRNLPYVFGVAQVDQAELNYELSVMRLLLSRQDIELNKADWSPKTKTNRMTPLTLAILSENGFMARELLKEPRVDLTVKSEWYADNINAVDAGINTGEPLALKAVLDSTKADLSDLSAYTIGGLIENCGYSTRLFELFQVLIGDARYPINQLRSFGDDKKLKLSDLMYASLKGSNYAVETILKRGDLQINSKSSENKTALTYAKTQTIRALLIKHGAQE